MKEEKGFMYNNNELSKVLSLYKISSATYYKRFVLQIIKTGLVTKNVKQEVIDKITSILNFSSTFEIRIDSVIKQIEWAEDDFEVVWDDAQLFYRANGEIESIITNTMLTNYFNERNQREIKNSCQKVIELIKEAKKEPNVYVITRKKNKYRPKRKEVVFRYFEKLTYDNFITHFSIDEFNAYCKKENISIVCRGQGWFIWEM